MRALTLTAVLAFGLGVAVALLATRGEPTRADGARNPESRSVADVPEVHRLRERLAAKTTEADELRATVDELTRKLEASGHTGGAPRAAESGTRRGRRRPRFVYAETEEALKAFDWDRIGGATAGLMPLLSEAADVVHGRKAMRAALWSDILTHVGPLITEATRLEAGGTRWTHPSVLVNLVHATLAKAGRPLNERQEEELYGVGLRYVEADQRRRAAYGEDTLQLRRMVDDVRQQD